MNIENIGEMSNEELDDIYDCNLKFIDEPIDSEGGDKAARLNAEQ